jgi:hypothetical protein
MQAVVFDRLLLWSARCNPHQALCLSISHRARYTRRPPPAAPFLPVSASLVTTPSLLSSPKAAGDASHVLFCWSAASRQPLVPSADQIAPANQLPCRIPQPAHALRP